MADTEYTRRMAGNSNSTVRFRKLAGNVSIQYRNDTAFVSWAPVKGESAVEVFFKRYILMCVARFVVPITNRHRESGRNNTPP